MKRTLKRGLKVLETMQREGIGIDAKRALVHLFTRNSAGAVVRSFVCVSSVRVVRVKRAL